MSDRVESELELLLRRAAQGDAGAAQDLLRGQRPRLKRMVAVHLDERLASRVDASDVVQEALLSASQRLPQYLKDPPQPFYPWLRQIAWDRLVDLHRRHLAAQKRSAGRERSVSADLPDGSMALLADRLAETTTSPSGKLVRQETTRRVREALARLPEDERDVLVLRYLEHLQTREVAAVLGITPAAAAKRHLRGLEHLRQKMGADLG